MPEATVERARTLADCVTGSNWATDRAHREALIDPVNPFSSQAGMLRSNDGFAEFWPDYLPAPQGRPAPGSAITSRRCRRLLGLYGIATLQIWYVIAAIVGGYALAVGSHYGFKDGKPLVGRSAVMGARADFRMIGLALTGTSRRRVSMWDRRQRERRETTVKS